MRKRREFSQDFSYIAREKVLLKVDSNSKVFSISVAIVAIEILVPWNQQALSRL